MAKFENRGFVRQSVQLQTGEVAHGLDLVEGVFHGRIAQVVKQLHAMDTEHGRQRIRRPLASCYGSFCITAVEGIDGQPNSSASSLTPLASSSRNAKKAP
jgi:hypothetical protein